jgi:hypothetical protein
VLVRLVEAVVRAAREIEGGNMESRVSKKIGFAPKMSLVQLKQCAHKA